jgi:hypothetical protein
VARTFGPGSKIPVLVPAVLDHFVSTCSPVLLDWLIKCRVVCDSCTKKTHWDHLKRVGHLAPSPGHPILAEATMTGSQWHPTAAIRLCNTEKVNAEEGPKATDPTLMHETKMLSQ